MIEFHFDFGTRSLNRDLMNKMMLIWLETIIPRSDFHSGFVRLFSVV